MRKLNALLIIAGVLALRSIVSAGGWLPALSRTFTPETSVQGQGFMPVEGHDFKSKLASAAERARSGNAPFWTAFSIDIRSGVAVDIGVKDYEALANGSAGANVARVPLNDTRQLGIFLLHAPDGSRITGIEVYDLGRQRDYGGHPVYWLGHIRSDESLGFFQNVAEAHQTPQLAERAVMVIALHDDSRVPSILKDYARATADARVRETAIPWLGQIGGEQTFLSDLVRDENERPEIRKRAALSLGIAKDKSALATIQSLYESVTQPEVKKQLLLAASLSENADESSDFLVKVAQGDGEIQFRKLAVLWVGLRGGTQGLKAIEDIISDPAADTELQKHAVLALGQRADSAALDLLLKVAKTHPKDVVRKRAIFWLGQKKDERGQELLKKALTK